jgi:hypothetical protein
MHYLRYTQQFENTKACVCTYVGNRDIVFLDIDLVGLFAGG